MESPEPPALKKRTTVMLPVSIIAEVDRVRGELGVSRSALLSMAASCFIAKTSDALKPENRKDSLDAIELIFAELLTEARGPV